MLNIWNFPSSDLLKTQFNGNQLYFDMINFFNTTLCSKNHKGKDECHTPVIHLSKISFFPSVKLLTQKDRKANQLPRCIFPWWTHKPWLIFFFGGLEGLCDSLTVTYLEENFICRSKVEGYFFKLSPFKGLGCSFLSIGG